MKHFTAQYKGFDMYTGLEIKEAYISEFTDLCDIIDAYFD